MQGGILEKALCEDLRCGIARSGLNGTSELGYYHKPSFAQVAWPEKFDGGRCKVHHRHHLLDRRQVGEAKCIYISN